MSPPKGIRLAIEACRPYSSYTSRPRPISNLRAFTTSRSLPAADITKGFPTPKASQPDPQNSKSTQPTFLSDSETSKDVETSPVLSRPPLNVLAAYHAPLKHTPQYGVPTCDLQLRSFSVRNLEFMGDFAMRAAYYLKLPASGPTPLPKRIERWTTIKSNFVHKKSQENFERITYKRLIQIKDGHKDAVEVWLAFLRKHQFYGVGMKANVWEYESLDVATKLDQQMEEVQKDLDAKLGMFGWNKQVAGSRSIEEMLREQGRRQVGVPMTYIREASQTKDNKI